MKKKINGILFLAALAFVFIFRKAIVTEIGQSPLVQKVTTKAIGLKPADKEVPDVGEGYYAYSTLNDVERLVYNQIADCILNYKKEVTISTSDQEIADYAFYCLLKDHPEIYWTDSYEMTNYKVSGIDTEYVFSPVYFMSKEERDNNQKLIDTAVELCLDGLPEAADQYETAKYLYEYIVLNTDYNKDVENDQNICSVFINKESVCAGYAKAYQYLLQKCGIEATIISGTADEEPHAWNLIKINNRYYFSDVTWGDPQYGSTRIQKPWYIDYYYLTMTTEDLLHMHTIENSFELPECTATEDNYFRRESLYLESFDTEFIDERIKKQLENGLFVSIRCSDQELFRQLKSYLFEEERIWELCSETDMTYSEDRKANVLTIFKQ